MRAWPRQLAAALGLAARAQVGALVRAGGWLVAAGQRGRVLWSEDAGRHWQQASVPVSSC